MKPFNWMLLALLAILAGSCSRVNPKADSDNIPVTPAWALGHIVWEDEFIGEGTLAVHVRHLREKIEKDPKNPEIIKTVWGVGYMIEE